MNSTKEILTLQLGHFSNYVGCHFWNIQETSFDYESKTPSEIDHDVLFREGINTKGHTTYTPRLLLVDLKGSFKHLSETGDLYKTEDSIDPTNCQNELYFDNLEVVKNEQIIENEFQKDLRLFNKPLKKQYDFENSVESWVDFLYSRYHSRTVNCISEYQHNNNEVAFDKYTYGSELWQKYNYSEEFTDKIRNYVEECDNMQGFQILFDAINGFSGYAASCIEHIRDEYHKSIFSLPLIPPFGKNFDSDNDYERKILDLKWRTNLMLSYTNIIENSSLVCPLSANSQYFRSDFSQKFNNLIFDHTNFYQTSGILAAAFDTLTLPYRTRNRQNNLLDMCDLMACYNRKLSSCSVSLPFQLNDNEFLIDRLNACNSHLSQSITPDCEIDNDHMIQLINLRGIPETKLKKPLALAGEQMKMAAYRCNNIHEMLDLYLASTYFVTLSQVNVVNSPLKVDVPFPNIFNNHVLKNGFISEKSGRAIDENVSSVPVLTGLHSGSNIGKMFKKMYEETSKVKYNKFQKLNPQLPGGVDQFSELMNELLNLSELYEQNF